MMALALWAALQSAPPAKPEKPLDPKDARSVAEHAVYNTRSQGDYQTRFTTRLDFPGSDPLRREGVCLWVSPGILSLHYWGAGGEDRNVLRAKDDVWVFERAGDLNTWCKAEAAGKDGAGRGFENPDEVLSALARHLDTANFGDAGVIDLKFSGADLGRIVKGDTELDPAKSSATVRLETDKDARVKKISLSASLQPKDPKVPGPAVFTAGVEVTAYNGKPPLKAVDAKGKDLPFTKEIQEAIRGLEPTKK
jgi:hypothetical protein